MSEELFCNNEFGEKLNKAADAYSTKIFCEKSDLSMSDLEEAFKAGAKFLEDEFTKIIRERVNDIMFDKAEIQKKFASSVNLDNTPTEVEHPNYYQTEGGIEVIEMMRMNFGIEAVYDFCLLNTFKYVARCRKKHKSPTQDLRKARYYLDYIVRNKEAEERKDEQAENNNV